MSTDILEQGRNASVQYAGSGSAWVQDMGVYARRVVKVVAGDVTTFYKGWAEYGVAESAEAWRIQRIVIDITSGFSMTDMQAGDGAFTERWDDRASLTYT